MIDMIVFCDRFFVIDWHNFLVIDGSLVIVWLLEFQLCYLPLQWPKEFSELGKHYSEVLLSNQHQKGLGGNILRSQNWSFRMYKTLVIGRRAWSRYLNEDWGSGITWEFPGGGWSGTWTCSSFGNCVAHSYFLWWLERAQCFYIMQKKASHAYETEEEEKCQIFLSLANVFSYPKIWYPGLFWPSL